MEKVDFGPLVKNMECVIAWAERHGSRSHGGWRAGEWGGGVGGVWPLFLVGQKQRMEKHRKGQGDIAS